MSYADCEAGVIATLQTLTTYFPDAKCVRANDFSVLDSGITKACAVTLPGGVGPVVTSPAFERAWQVILILYYRYTTPTETNTKFIAMRDVVIHKLDQVSGLGTVAEATGIYNSSIASEGDPQEVKMANVPDSGPVFLGQTFRLTVYQTVTL